MGISWGYNGKMGISREESGGFHSHGGTPIAGLFKRENPIKIDDLGVTLF